MCRTVATHVFRVIASTLFLAVCLLLAAILIPAVGKLVDSPRADAQSTTAVRAAEGNHRRDDAGDWRRTTRGWEHASNWRQMRPRRRLTPPLAAVHPLVPAGLILLLSVAALVVFSPSGKKLVVLASRR